MSKRSWKDTYSGGFLKAADLPRNGKRTKLGDITEEVIRKGESEKLIADISGFDGKRWVLNTTNCELLEEILGSDDPDNWVGGTIELFNDRTVRGPNGEKGGIRCRAASKGKRSKPADEDADLDDFEDEDDD